MSTHPNVLLILRLTPDGLARKTYREIVEGKEDDSIHIAGQLFHHHIAETTYDTDAQISQKEGDIIFWSCVTYGYGEDIKWAELVAIRDALEQWAEAVCKTYHCSREIVVSANYW